MRDNLTKDIYHLFDTIEIMCKTNCIQDFLEMIDDLWYNAFAESVTFIRNVEKKFHQNLFSGQISGIAKWSNVMFEIYIEGKRTLDCYKELQIYQMHRGYKILGKPWKDTNIARILAEWHYYFGMMLPKNWMCYIVDKFIVRFLSEFKNYHDFQKLVKIITIVFWATYKCNSDIWYKDAFDIRYYESDIVLYIFRHIRSHAISCGFVKPQS